MKHIAATVLFSALAFSADAQGILKDYYLHTFAGGTNASSSSIESKGIDLDVGSGYSVGIAAGRSVNNWLRLEFEWSYRHNDVDDLSGESGLYDLLLNPNSTYKKLPGGIEDSLRQNTKNFESDLSYSTIMVNAYYDHEINDKVSVYGGLGLGFSVAEITVYAENNIHANPNMGGAASQSWYNEFITLPRDQRGVAFAWQLQLGLAYNINQNFSLSFAYKLFAPGDFEDIDNIYVNSFDVGATYLF